MKVQRSKAICVLRGFRNMLQGGIGSLDCIFDTPELEKGDRAAYIYGWVFLFNEPSLLESGKRLFPLLHASKTPTDIHMRHVILGVKVCDFLESINGSGIILHPEEGQT